MFALKLFSHPKKLSSVTGMNFMVYLTKFCLPFLYSWGEIGGDNTRCLGVYMGYVGLPW